MDENGGKTVPYRSWKRKILERVRGRRRRRENWYGKRGGGNSTVSMPATLWSQHKKKRFVREIKGKRRRSLNSHMHKINKEHASEEVRRF